MTSKSGTYPFEVSEPFGTGSDEQINIEIYLDDILDRYAYHDAPYMIDTYWDKEKLTILIAVLESRLQKMK